MHASFSRNSDGLEIQDGGGRRGRETAIARSLGLLLEEMVTRRDVAGATAIAEQLAGQLRKLDGLDP